MDRIGYVQIGYRSAIGPIQVPYRMDIGQVQVGYRTDIGKPQENHRTGIGQVQEKHRKHIGKTQEDVGKTKDGYRKGIVKVNPLPPLPRAPQPMAGYGYAAGNSPRRNSFVPNRVQSCLYLPSSDTHYLFWFSTARFVTCCSKGLTGVCLRTQRDKF